VVLFTSYPCLVSQHTRVHWMKAEVIVVVLLCYSCLNFSKVSNILLYATVFLSFDCLL
jgi:hypothetical protein